MLSAEEQAKQLGIATAAVELTRRCEVIDLHIDTFIPYRLWGYDVLERHAGGPLGGRFFGHLDLPRMTDGGLTAAMWSITTNPVRSASGRFRVLEKNVTRLKDIVERSAGGMGIARNRREYDEVRKRGAHVCLFAIQGGNALEAAPDGVGSIPDQLITRVTVVHLTNSSFGATSSPLGRGKRELTDLGRDLVRDLNRNRVFVDLAHIHPQGFWDAVAVHDRSQPLIATHTGVSGVTPHWRNLDDGQLKAIADTGGTVGIMFHTEFLRAEGKPVDGRLVVDHIEHVIDVVGEDHVSLGSDYDGAITPPPDIRNGEYPRLVAYMLERRWSETRIEKVLGGNFLRAFALLRP